MALVEVNWNPDRRQLKQFALLWIGFFGILGAIGLWAGYSPTAVTALWLIAAAGIVGYFIPHVMRPVYVVWMALALPIGWTISHFLLLAVYYLIFTPVALLLRLVGYDPLARHFDRSAKSYWTPHDPGVAADRYFKQY
jgi:hypothetical protein